MSGDRGTGGVGDSSAASPTHMRRRRHERIQCLRVLDTFDYTNEGELQLRSRLR